MRLSRHPCPVVLFVALSLLPVRAEVVSFRPQVWGTDEVAKRRHLQQAEIEEIHRAASLLHHALVASKTYPSIPGKCLAFEAEDAFQGKYHFAAKVDQGICGPPTSSNLLDRYRVELKRGRVFLYDVGAETYTLVWPTKPGPAETK